MSLNEEAVVFGEAENLVGVVSEPTDGKANGNVPAFVLLNAGLVHRVGPNRFYVTLARELASAGYVTLRFDFSGVGDSGPVGNSLPFEENSVKDTKDALDFLATTRGIERFILFGLCSGAMISFDTASCDPRIVGIAMINPIYSSDGTSSYVQTRHFWRSELMNRALWLRIFTGDFRWKNLVSYAISMVESLKGIFSSRSETMSEARRVAANLSSLADRGVALYLASSWRDLSKDFLDMVLSDEVIEDPTLNGLLSKKIIEEADHTFTSRESREELIGAVKSWTQSL